MSTFTAAEQGRGYLDLMKLRVVELLLVTTVPALVLAEGKLPGLVVTAASIIGRTLAAGAANAYNMIIESDIDKLMARTSKRPLVTGVLSKVQATDRIRIQRIKHELERRGLPRRIIDKAVRAYQLRQYSGNIQGPSSFLRMLEVLSHAPYIVHFSQVLRDLFVSDEERDRIIHIFQILLSEQT